MADGSLPARSFPAPPEGLGLLRAETVFKLDPTSGQGRAALLSGWSDPEPGLVWMTDDRSELSIALPRSHQPLQLVTRLVPYGVRADAPPLRLRATVNGCVLMDDAVARPRLLSFPLSGMRLADAPALRVVFDHPDQRVPNAINGSGDTRRLSFALTSFRLVDYQPLGPDLPMTGWSFPEEPTDAEMLMVFESLGHNCEFGLVQRRLGADPLSLLRFAATPLENLLAMMDQQFAHLLDPSEIDIEAVPLESGDAEYQLHHRRYDFRYHTLTFASQMSVDRCRHRETGRLTIALRRLREQLAAGDRICVFKHEPGLSAGDMLALHLALQAYGPNTLLCVTEADAAHQAGTVRPLLDGLMHGVIPKFAPLSDATSGDDQAWLTICRRAYALWTSRRR